MHVTIKKWGNTPSVRIPASLLARANLSLDAVVDVRVENGCLVIAPVYPKALELEALIAGLTSRRLHAEVDFDWATGQEAF